MIFTVEPMINAGKPRHPRAGRRLDHRDQGPQPVGAMGAHRAGDRDGFEVLTVSRRHAAAARHPHDDPDSRGAPNVRRAALTGAVETAARGEPRSSSKPTSSARSSADQLRAAAPQLVDRHLRETWQSSRCRRHRRSSLSAAMVAASFSRTPTSTCCLLPAAADALLTRALEQLIGTAVGHRSGSRPQRAHRRGMRAAAESDITIQTSLLEARLIAGNRRFSATFAEATATRSTVSISSRRSSSSSSSATRAIRNQPRAQHQGKRRAACATCRRSSGWQSGRHRQVAGAILPRAG